MKIAIALYRMKKMGGLETRLHNYVKWFLDHGHEVTAICQRYDLEREWDSRLKIVKLSVGITPKIFRALAYNWRVASYMQTHSFDFSLSIQQVFSLDVTLAGSNHRGYLKANEIKIWKPSDWMIDYLERKTYSNSKIIFACSQTVSDNITELIPEMEKNKIRILHPPVNTHRYHFAERQSKQREFIREKLGMKQGAKVFLFVSNSHVRKGLGILMNAFQELPNENVQLFIIGRPAVHTSLRNIFYAGYRNDLEEYYQASDFTIHPARYEAFGQIISESLQCGTPVIISARVGAKEILNKEEGLVVDSFDPEVWRRIIQEVKPEQFKVLPDFATRKKLSLDEHMNAIMKEAELMKK